MRVIGIAAAVLALTSAAGAQQLGGSTVPTRSINSYGVPGLIDMPSAQMQPDGELVTSLYLLSNGIGRTQLSFQLLPRVQGVFRYATLPDFLTVGPRTVRTYDRSFDLRVQLLREQGWLPDLTVGLQDFGGTSLYSGEYVVATKTFGPRITATAGIGWGRYGSDGGFRNPLSFIDDRFETRPSFAGSGSRGGEFSTDQWFRGEAAFFAGIEYRPNDRWTLKAEVSSDGYTAEEGRGILERDVPVNFGVDYQLRPGVRIGAYALGGTEVGVNVAWALNPKRAPVGASGYLPAPVPVLVRPSPAELPALWSEAWIGQPALQDASRDLLAGLLEAEGLGLISYRLTPDRAFVTFRNPRYRSQSQAIGRVARAMSNAVPATVETFVIAPENDQSLASAAVVVRRSDLEALENRPNGAAEVLAVAGIVDAATVDREAPNLVEGAYPRYRWNVGPYIAYGLFDPDKPFKVDVGVAAGAEVEPVRGLVLSGVVQQRLAGNRFDTNRPSNSVLPRVRTNTFQFLENDGPTVEHLTAAYFFRPGKDLYARGSAGLLERQFGGVSAELLWKPVNSRLAIGLEASRVTQREFDGGFGFQDLDATTGFVSAYYDHGARFLSQLDVGQYLAGDRGATYTLTREFSNGWQVGAYATMTNVSAQEFGEGSFDKGIFLRVPTAWATGQPSRNTTEFFIQPIQRDGGARLRLRDRIYPLVRDQSPPVLTEEWGRFWR